MPFVGHGAYTLTLFRDILLLTISGSTNLELFNEIENKLDDYRLMMDKLRWALIMDCRNWELATPEYIEAMKEHATVSPLKGRRCDDQILMLNSQFVHSVLLGRFSDSPEVEAHVTKDIWETIEILEEREYKGSDELLEYWENEK